ncbi:MAG: zinc-binding dehydrogenase [Bacteroidales bacterium]|jgi:NADPH:quinone reductase-like Zn-dependent oxidoreductase|nr:zinc-binding dehydrogenase [Bacteroidales bacterium]MDD3700397.1 zinc-binding dehydrogenase [Bacteroidales bacterium]MDY0368717.1 zinc-binding dehydrogenase [Bacteroidales bacterium]
MSKITYPFLYKAVELAEYKSNILRSLLSLRWVEKRLESLPDDHLLVKVDAASCNPSDIAFLQGAYQVKKPVPAVPGFEASGTVVDIGAKVLNKTLVGKRVACFTQSDAFGTWAEYVVLKPSEILLHDQRFSVQQSAGFFVNPFTAYGLFELALEKQSKAIVVNAAGSVVASWLHAFAKQFGLHIIGIVRNRSTARMLSKKGWETVLVSSSDGFEEKLRDALAAYTPIIGFDAVGGEASGQLIRCLPDSSFLVVYGGLSAKAIGDIPPLRLIFGEHTIRGFNLNNWLKRASTEKIELAASVITEILLENKDLVSIQAEVSAENLVEGLKKYLGNMSAGKILIRF